MEIEWRNFNKTNVRQAFPAHKSKHLLAMRRDGKAYCGIVDAVTDRWVELSNGDDRQILYYDQAPMQFCVVEPPPLPQFRMAESRLNLEGSD